MFDPKLMWVLMWVVVTKDMKNVFLPISKEGNYTHTRGQKLFANTRISDFQNKT